MKKEEYFQRLEQLLYSIPAEDREEALQYYRDYLEDAGPEAEEAVLRSFGTPEELAESIRKGMYGIPLDGDYSRVHREVPGTPGTPEPTPEKEPRKGKLTLGQWILFLLLALCAAPVIVPIFAVVFAVIVAVVCLLVGLLLAFGIGGVALVIAAIAVIISALIKVIVTPVTALVVLGGGLLMIGFGVLGVAIAAWIVFKVLPALFRGLVNFFSRLVHGR